MIFFRFFLHPLFNFYFLLIVLLVFSLSPFSLFQQRERLYALSSFLLKIAFLLSFVRVKLDGDSLPPADRGVVYIANRRWLFAPLYLIAYFPQRLRIIADQQIAELGPLGAVAERLGMIFYDESRSGKSWRHSAVIYAALKNKEKILVFYQNLTEQSAGVGVKLIKMALAAGALVVPLKISPFSEDDEDSDQVLVGGKVLLTVKKPLSLTAGGEEAGFVEIKGFFEEK